MKQALIALTFIWLITEPGIFKLNPPYLMEMPGYRWDLTGEMDSELKCMDMAEALKERGIKARCEDRI